MTLPEVEGYVVMLRELREELLKHIAAVDPAALNWKPSAAETNSIFVLATHVTGSEQYWLQQMVGGIDVKRNRPAEFEARGADAEALTQRIHDVARQSEELLRSLDAADLSSTRKTPRERTVQWCILHVIEHLSRHVGHIELTRQLYDDRQSSAHRS